MFSQHFVLIVQPLKFMYRKATWFETTVHLLVKVEKKSCGIWEGFGKVITFYHVTCSNFCGLCYKESMETGANLAFSKPNSYMFQDGPNNLEILVPGVQIFQRI